MAQQADGTVYIDTLLDTTGFKAGGKDVEAAVRRMSKTVSGIGETAKIALQKQTGAFVKANQAYAQQEQKVESLRQKLEEMSNQKVATDEFKEIGKQIDNDTAKLNRLEKAQEEFLAVGGKESSSAYRRRELEIEELRNSIKYAKSEQEELLNTGGAYKAVDTSSVEQKLSNEEQRLQNMNNSLATSYASLKNKVEKYGGSANNLTKIKNRLTKAFSSFLSSVKKTAKSIGGSLLSGVKKLGASMLGLGKNTKSSNNAFGGGLKTMLKYGLGIRSLFVLVNKLRSALVEGFKNLAQYDGQTNASISSLMSALTQLKNSFATAFAPILNVVAPILTSFINLISAAVSKVGMLIAALTGQNTFTKAVAVQQDYAASLNDTSKGINDATKATKKAEKETNDYLSGLDEIRRWESPDKSNAESSDSGIGGGYVAPTPGEMFETVPIENSLKNLADKIRGFFQSEDWQGLGDFIADGLNRGMEKIKTAISWENVGPSVTHFVEAFTTTLNSLVDNFDWNLLGETIGTGINTIVKTINLLADSINWQRIGTGIADGFNGLFDTVDAGELGKALSQKIRIAIETLYGFVTTFDWSKLGTWIGDGINGFFDNIDFGLLAKTLSKGIIGVLNSLSSAIEQVDWYALGKKVQDFLVNIDWGGICEALFEALGAALAGLAEFTWGLIEDAWNSVVKWWKDTAYEDGKFTIKGLLNGIMEALKNIKGWIKEHIVDPFVNGFRNVFGINSPSTVMAEQGGYIISGLLSGLKEKFLSVIEWLSGLPEKFKEFFQKAKDNIVKVFSNIGSWFSEKFSTAWTSIKNAFSLSKAKAFFKEVWSGIKSAFGNITSWFKEKFSSAWQAVKDVFSSGGRVFEGIKDGILNGLKAVINGLIRGINEVIVIPFDGINWALRNIRDIDIMGFRPFSWLGEISVPQIPYLAKGAVIPPNAPFMAVLGDQRRGTNIEAPLSTIEQAVTNAMKKNGGADNVTIRIPVILDGRQVFEAVIDEAKMKQMISGKNPFEMA